MLPVSRRISLFLIVTVALVLSSASRVEATISYGGIYINSGINTPGQFYVDSGGNIYIANSGTSTNSKVTKFNSAGTLQASVLLTSPSAQKPQGLAFNPSNSTIYVTGYISGVIYAFDTDLGSQTTVVTGLSHPVGLAVNADGSKLYVVMGGTGSNSPGSGNIKVYSTGDYSLLQTISMPSMPKIANPVSIAVDAAENIYIAEYRPTNIASVWGNGKVLKYAAETQTFTTIDSGLVDTDNANTADSPSGITLDDAGNIYVLVRGSRAGGSGSIRKYSSNGTFIEQHRTLSDSSGVLNMPYSGIQVDANYRIYASNTNGSKIAYYEQTIDTPTNLAISSDDGTVSLSWSHIADSRLASYTIRRSMVGYPSSVTDGDAVAAGLTSTTSNYNDADLNSGTYYYSLFSIDTIGNASPAATATITVTNVGPSAPSSVSADRSGATAHLSWVNPVLDFASITIRRSADSYPTSISDGTNVVSNAIATTNYSDASLADGVYYYSIFALDAQGNASVAGTTAVTIDTTAPSITMLGEASVTLTVGDTYTDAGATASDATDGSLTGSLVVNNAVDTSVAGTYSVTYNVDDAAGNHAATRTRTVIVQAIAVTPPVEDHSEAGQPDELDQPDEAPIEESDSTNETSDQLVDQLTASTDGQYLTIMVDGAVVEQVQLGEQLPDKHKVRRGHFYIDYDTIAVLRLYTGKAKLTVFRLDAEHNLTKKSQIVFDTTRTKRDLQYQPHQHTITVMHRFYRLTKQGELIKL